MSCRSSLSRNEGADNMPDDALAPPLVPVTWTLSRQNHAETRGVCQTGKECVASLVTSVTFLLFLVRHERVLPRHGRRPSSRQGENESYDVTVRWGVSGGANPTKHSDSFVEGGALHRPDKDQPWTSSSLFHPAHPPLHTHQPPPSFKPTNSTPPATRHARRNNEGVVLQRCMSYISPAWPPHSV